MLTSRHPFIDAPRSATLVILLGAFGCAAIVLSALLAPAQMRFILAGELLVLITGLTLRNPPTASLFVLAFLPFLGFFRRLLIPLAGYPVFDPLLTIGAFTGLVLFIAATAKGKSANDTLSLAILVLLALTLVEVFNPNSGGIFAGLISLPFAAGPLLWYFAGKAFSDARITRRVLLLVLIAASLSAAYGLTQIALGLTPWDAAWLDVAGYGSLYVYDLHVLGGIQVLRAFSTFSSSGEYAQYVFMGLTVAIVLLAYRKLWALLLAPLLATAGILDSTRGVVVATLVALAAALGARTGSRRRAALTFVGIIVVAIAAVQFFGGAATQAARATNNPLISHEVGGLANPFDARESTLTIHFGSIVAALSAIPQNPIGAGPASTTLATAKFGLAAQDSEFDLTNAFVSGGVVGGLTYLFIVTTALYRAGSLAIRRRDYVSVAAFGLLVLTLGSWLRGAAYALTPTIWFLVGSTSRAFLATRASEPVTSDMSAAYAPAVGSTPPTGVEVS